MQVRDDDGGDWTEPGVFRVAPGVHRIPLPLPSDGLRAVNVYALVDGDSLVLVDSGWALAEARERLERALRALGAGLGDVRRFLVTHVHRDHYTMAVALRREFGAHVALGTGERETIAAVADPARRPLEAQAALLRRHGAHELAAWVDALPRDQQVDPETWAEPDEWLEPPRVVPLATRTLQAVATPGHTRGHLVFDDGGAGLLFAGDHVLPHITPSIGLEAVPVAHPLRDYLASLRLVRARPDRRLLPAHGPVTASVHARVDELLAHHDTRLADTAAAVARGARTAAEAAAALPWTRRRRALADLDPFNQVLAVCETAAHLDVLVLQGRVAVTDGADGVRQVSAPASPSG